MISDSINIIKNLIMKLYQKSVIFRIDCHSLEIKNIQTANMFEHSLLHWLFVYLYCSLKLSLLVNELALRLEGFVEP